MWKCIIRLINTKPTAAIERPVQSCLWLQTLSREVIKVIQYHRFFLWGGISAFPVCVCSCVAYKSKVLLTVKQNVAIKSSWVFVDISGPLTDPLLWMNWTASSSSWWRSLNLKRFQRVRGDQRWSLTS